LSNLQDPRSAKCSQLIAEIGTRHRFVAAKSCQAPTERSLLQARKADRLPPARLETLERDERCASEPWRMPLVEICMPAADQHTLYLRILDFSPAPTIMNAVSLAENASAVIVPAQ
jgi:hypothetical protein